MSTEYIPKNKVVIDTRDVAAKLSFLVGKTITFRNGYPDDDAVTTTQVIAVKAENTPGLEGYPKVSIYTHVGIRNIEKSKEFHDIMVWVENNECQELKSLGSITEEMGIHF